MGVHPISHPMAPPLPAKFPLNVFRSMVGEDHCQHQIPPPGFDPATFPTMVLESIVGDEKYQHAIPPPPMGPEFRSILFPTMLGKDA
ncbi:hypothetical protein AMJ82_10830 [candidate division TA06 bacterium SM23_40]|uniref:Uncharacterized protein n=1 Tax=candidate division TA06 bacterium SM23_40 TaxID=1703774 RepID=A0A0S8G621_UNCT6|nr:MAG: hypothetical protein AMJ82_10830 [candidate division TA06 bacterium SM23_40]